MEAGDNIETPSNFDYTSLNTSGIISPKLNLSPQENSNTEVLNISGKYNSLIIAKNITIDINEFNRLNPGFDMVMSSGEGYDLRLPSEKMDLFVANKYPILNECVQVLLNDTNADTKTVTLNLGAIDDHDSTFVNGQLVGAVQAYNEPRKYTIPAGLLKPGKNVLAIPLTDPGGGGGFMAKADDLTLTGRNWTGPLAGHRP